MKRNVVRENRSDLVRCPKLKPTPYLKAPDYSLPLLEVTKHMSNRLLFKLQLLYGLERGEAILPELQRLMKVFYAHKPPELREWEKHFVPEERFSEQDVILITYGDLVTSPKKSPLKTLAFLAHRHLRGAINTIHILPFFPYSSDRGFAVMDFGTVDPHLGTWQDIAEINGEFRLMFDGVINHASSKSHWFQEFLNGDPYFRDFFIQFGPEEEIQSHLLALILRPRTTDLLTPFVAIDGEKRVWTTFGPDQVDLNYQSEKVLLKMVEILLYYVRRGADLIRLDAISYLWEEVGTRCVHLDQTHIIVRLFRDVLDCVAPYVALVTETNVPHQENIEYFGNGSNEAQMVYNFALPPLVLHTFHTGDCSRLAAWASTLEKPSDTATFLNFLDSHDGIGVLPAEGILRDAEIQDLCDRILKHGGFISYRAGSEGQDKPYELNSTWFSALNDPSSGESEELQVGRFVASRSIALALRGVPAIYLHGLLGSQNDTQDVLITRAARSVNRHNINEQTLLQDLDDLGSRVSRISGRIVELIRMRISSRAFHPNGDQEILDIGPAIFGVRRVSPEGGERVVCLTNVTADTQSIRMQGALLREAPRAWKDMITGQAFLAEAGDLSIVMPPYGVLWLQPWDN
jgi:glycosidase